MGGGCWNRPYGSFELGLARPSPFHNTLTLLAEQCYNVEAPVYILLLESCGK